MYTTVFYDDEYNVIRTQESGTKPHFKNPKYNYYVVKGAFDGVVDPSKGVDSETNEQRLERKLKAAEDALFEFVTKEA